MISVLDDLALNIACEDKSYTNKYLQDKITSEYNNLKKDNLKKSEIINQIRFKLSSVVHHYSDENIYDVIEKRINNDHIEEDNKMKSHSNIDDVFEMKNVFKPNFTKKKNNHTISSVKILDNDFLNKKNSGYNVVVDNKDKELIEYKIDLEKNCLIKKNNDTTSLINTKQNSDLIGKEKKEKKEKKEHVVIPFDISVQLLQNYIEEKKIVDKKLIFFAISNEMIDNSDFKSIISENDLVKNQFIESQLFIVEDKLRSINERFEFINFKKNDELKTIESNNFNNIKYDDCQLISIDNNQIHVYLIDSILEKFQ